MSTAYRVIDPRVLWRAAADDRACFQALAQTFIEQAPALLARLETALAQRHVTGIAAVSHALRGMTMLVGAAELSALLQQLEQAARSAAPLSPAAPLAPLFELVMAEVAHSQAHYRGEGEGRGGGAGSAG